MAKEWRGVHAAWGAFHLGMERLFFATQENGTWERRVLAKS